MVLAIYPGTFDPITNGHVDIIKRASKLFSRLIVAIGENPAKKPLFSREERLEMVKEVIASLNLSNVEAEIFDGLLINYVKNRKAKVIIRGLRAVSDFEYEMQLALMNRKLDSEIDTVFLVPSLKWMFLSSSIVKEVARLKGDVKDLVPPVVLKKLEEKFKS